MTISRSFFLLIGLITTSIFFQTFGTALAPTLACADELKQIKLKIEAEDLKLVQIKKERNQLGLELQKVKLELTRLDKIKIEQNQVLARTENELKVVELSQSETDRKLVAEAFSLETSLIELYKIQKKRKGLELLLNADSSMGLLKRGHQLSTMARYGDGVISRLAIIKEQLGGEKLKFQELLVRRRQDIEEIQKTVDSVAVKKKESQVLLNESQKKEKEQKVILQGLTEQARAIERAIASITGEDKETVDKGTAVKGTVDKDEGPSVDGYDGVGLAEFKGKLPFPVKGKLVQSFGKSQNQEFSDLVMVKGLEVAASVGAKVTSIASGKVVLADVVPGFGNVVIVDHGSRFYSLYGRLSITLAKVGSIVSTSDPVGITGELDFKGRNFYLEIRVKGKAVDPKGYFSSQAIKDAGA